MSDEQLQLHKWISETRLNVKLEKNSKGYNYEVTVTGAASVDEAIFLLKDAKEKLEKEFSNGTIA